MKTVAIGRGTVAAIGKLIDFVVLIGVALVLTFAGYALWDSNQIHQAADKSQYAVFKPTIIDEGKSFLELQSINPEVFSWLCVYGTNIDYPVTQGQNNMKYVNTNAEGAYSLSGAIFLDSGNSMDFSDFNNILYGHHMEKKTMFGEIGEFSDSEMFDTHQYGNIYFDGADHGIEFFAFVHTDAYDGSVYSVNAQDEKRKIYLDGLLAKAKYVRDIGVTDKDHIVLLSTCSSDSTNGRDILVGRVVDDVYANPFLKDEENESRGNRTGYGLDKLGIEASSLPRYIIIVSGSLMLICIMVIITRQILKAKKSKKRSIEKNTTDSRRKISRNKKTEAEHGYL